MMTDIVQRLTNHANGAYDMTPICSDLLDAKAEIERLKAEVERWKEASTPSAETKAAYWGEFHISDEILDDEGNYITRKVAVPWITVKEIMAAISARAALTQEKTDV